MQKTRNVSLVLNTCFEIVTRAILRLVFWTGVSKEKLLATKHLVAIQKVLYPSKRESFNLQEN